jgi:hypothetical protein
MCVVLEAVLGENPTNIVNLDRKKKIIYIRTPGTYGHVRYCRQLFTFQSFSLKQPVDEIVLTSAETLLEVDKETGNIINDNIKTLLSAQPQKLVFFNKILSLLSIFMYNFFGGLSYFF